MLQFFRLTLWIIFWFFTWPVLKLFQKKGQQNCVTWALDEWKRKDGYLVIRWCRSSKYQWFRWPHLLFLDQEHHEKLRHFLPQDTSKLKKRLIPDMWFDGKEKQGDDPESMEEN